MKTLFTTCLICTGLLSAFAPEFQAHAQTAPPDTLRLLEVRAAAATNDPVIAQRALVDVSSALRQQNLRATRLPQVGFSGQATWQNEVPELGFGGMTIEGPPLEQARAQAELQWLLYDGGRSRWQRRAESLRQEESLAGVELTLQRLMEGASETYFSALLQAAQIEVLEASASALEERLDFLKTRVEDGAATAADAAALEAEWLGLLQQRDQARSLHRASLEVLGAFIGREVSESTILAVPDLSSHVEQARLEQARSAGMSSPEIAQLNLRVDRLLADADAVRSIRRPQVSLFGQAGVGRPSPFDFLDPETSPFALAGVRMQWSIMDWGQARRNREVLEAQADLTATAAASTERHIERELSDDVALDVHLASVVETDDRIVALREQVVEATRKQVDAGATPPPVFAERLAELTAAKTARARNRIERARAQYRILALIGALPAPRNPEDSYRTGN